MNENNVVRETSAPAIPPTWREMHPQEDPAVEALQFRRFGAAPASEKACMLHGLVKMARGLALAGVRSQFPEATSVQARLELASRILGSAWPEACSIPEGTLMIEVNPLEVAVSVAQSLEALEVEYFIGGSIASTLHGMVRTTNDVDIIADLSRDRLRPFLRRHEAAFYVVESAAREAIRNRSSFNLIHVDLAFKVDIFIPGRGVYDRVKMERRVREVVLDSPQRSAFITTPEDSILAKLQWFDKSGRTQDRQWRDVLGVIKAKGEVLDREYLRVWAVFLGLEDLLDRAFTSAQR